MTSAVEKKTFPLDYRMYNLKYSYYNNGHLSSCHEKWPGKIFFFFRGCKFSHIWCQQPSNIFFCIFIFRPRKEEGGKKRKISFSMGSGQEFTPFSLLSALLWDNHLSIWEEHQQQTNYGLKVETEEHLTYCRIYTYVHTYVYSTCIYGIRISLAAICCPTERDVARRNHLEIPSTTTVT